MEEMSAMLMVKVENGRFKIWGVYANGELANLYFSEEEAIMAVDDLIDLGVSTEMEIMSVIL